MNTRTPSGPNTPATSTDGSINEERVMPKLLREWRGMQRISEEVFNKVARENAIELLGLSG